jgi:PAS domain S-box-containing protein
MQQEYQMAEWIKVADVADLSPAGGAVVDVGGQSVAVFSVGGELCAIDNTCPHQGGPLGEGTLEGDVVTCPWHGWSYSVRTGCPVLTPPVKTFDVRRNGSSIELGVSGEERERYERWLAETDISGRTAVSQILSQIQQGRTLDEVIEKVYVRLQEVLPHNRIGIALIDNSSNRLVQVKTRSDRRILLDDGFSAAVSGSSLERILALGEARIIDDLQEHYVRRPSEWTKLILAEGMRSSLTLPLKVEGKPIGVVFFTSVTPRAFTESHVAWLKQVAGQLSVLIEKGRWVSDLAQSNERYRTLFEMSNEGIFLCASTSDRFLTLNENLCRWLGYLYEDLRVLSLADLLSPQRLAEANALLAEHPDGSTPVTLDAELFKKDLGTLPAEIRLAWTTRGGQRFLQGFVRDLSEVQELNAQLRRQYSFEGLIGKSRNIQEVYELIREVAPLTTTVLIQGESGTGKELVARAIHQNSVRRKRPFVAVNCGALVETLLESELFGHVRGAFSGATNTRQGRFEIANGGTIFLDEVAELSPATQVKLLRVLQEGEFEKVGSSATQNVDVRVIAATNRDLKAAMRSGRVREDLYYRLNVVPIVIPPLRERREDIPLLIEHFIGKFNRQLGRTTRDVSREVMAILIDHQFAGNVRELENIIEFAFVKCQGRRIERRHLPPDLRGSTRDVVSLALTAKQPLKALERELIRRILQDCNADPQVAAERLGVSRTTLWRKLRDPTAAAP